MRTANAGSFKPGLTPWNKNVRGLRMSPATEFKRGQDAHNHLPVGSVQIRQRKNRREAPRAWIKVAEPNVWKMRAVHVWETAHGSLPIGKVVHHRDRNALNDSLDNLQALTRAEHLAEHRHEWRS